MGKYAVKPSLLQAVRLKKLKQTVAMRFRKFFPHEYPKQQIEAVIT